MLIDTTLSIAKPMYQAEDKLSHQEKRKLENLKALDADVRIQEEIHSQRATPYVRGNPTYLYEVGPDGKRYVVGGQVNIDNSVPSSPEEALEKARVLAGAATAPKDPSPADYAAAAASYAYANKARETLKERTAASLADPVASAAKKLEKISVDPLNPTFLGWG